MSFPSKTKSANGRAFNSQQSLNGAIKSICDIMRRSNCAGALQYVPELTWILFLRILDEREASEAEAADAERDEQKGFMFLFKRIVSLKNSKAHSNRLFNDPYRAHDYLALASLLMRLLEIASSNPKP
jgi:type I restriction-modification system DNA methylase subunit